jgi:DNA-binding IscR family transcriptional regulator
VRLLNSVIAQLTEMGLLGELSDAPGSFALLRAPEALKVRDVVVGMLEFGVNPTQLGLRRVDDVVRDVVAKVSSGIKGELAEVTVLDMVGNER